MQHVGRSLFEFAGAADQPRWNAVNDDVMGGRSLGAARIADGLLHFTGVLSLENGGGFASVRSAAGGFDLRGAAALLLRARGDGLRYQLRVATDARFRGTPIWYGAAFDTSAGDWTTVRTPFTALLPRYRGSVLQGPPLDLARVEWLGLLVGDRQAGPFCLALEWIRIE